MMKLMRTFLLFLCAVTILEAQDPAALLRLPSLEHARRWITDPRPRYRAWAADLIRRHDTTQLTAELISALEVTQTGPLASAGDLEKMRLIVLDALIQTRSLVPGEISLQLYQQFPAQAAILLFRSGCPTAEISQKILQNAASEPIWLAAARCLAREPGGPLELLRDLKVNARVFVYDQGYLHGRGGVVFTASIPDCPPSAPPPPPRRGQEEWPDVYSYCLSARPDILTPLNESPLNFRRVNATLESQAWRVFKPAEEDGSCLILQIFGGLPDRPNALSRTPEFPGLLQPPFCNPTTQFQFVSISRLVAGLAEYEAELRRQFELILDHQAPTLKP